MDKNTRSVAQSVLRTVWPSHVLSFRCRSAVRARRSAQKGVEVHARTRIGSELCGLSGHPPV